MKMLMENWNKFINEEEPAAAKIDRQFLRKFVFELPRKDDEEQIASQAESQASEVYKFRNAPLYGLNNGNFSIAIPSGDSFEIYVSYADTREKMSKTDLKPSAFTSLLRKELESMGFKDGELPAPMSDANLQSYRTPMNKSINEIRFRPKTPSELGMIVDSLINKFYSGEIENDKLFEELRIYFAAVSKEHEMSVDELIDHLIEKRFSDELSGFLFDPKYREMLKMPRNQ
jgi:hypothetical protein